MAILDIKDLVILRAAAGRIIAITDHLVTPEVFSYRLERPPPRWTFRRPTSSFRMLREEARVRLLAASPLADCFMCRTDVSSYFPSIDHRALLSELADWDIDLSVINLVMTAFNTWSQRAGLLGLPIGPELSAVLGNAFLVKADRRLKQIGVPHLRYMDDFFLFGDRSRLDAAVEALDDELSDLRLSRSVEKTHFFEDVFDAIEEVEDTVLQYASSNVRGESPVVEKELHRLFDIHIREADSPTRSRFRWVIEALTRRKDPYGLCYLLEHQELMAVDPRRSGNYVAIGKKNQVARDGLMDMILQPSSDERDAVDLHMLKAASEWSWGGVEGEVFLSIATDESRRSPVRSWAWSALRRSPKWRHGLAMEAAIEEGSPRVCRAIVASLRGGASRSSLAPFTKAISRRQPDLTQTCNWVLAA